MRNPSKENPKEIKPKKIWDPNIIIECGEIKPKDGEEYPSKKEKKKTLKIETIWWIRKIKSFGWKNNEWIKKIPRLFIHTPIIFIIDHWEIKPKKFWWLSVSEKKVVLLIVRRKERERHVYLQNFFSSEYCSLLEEGNGNGINNVNGFCSGGEQEALVYI